jgi:dTDP-glucose 4,6-dehydratase
MTKKTILITGVAGFIGSHLCDRSLALGYRVVGVDNFLTGNPRNIDHLKSCPDFEFLEQNVSDEIAYSGPVDYILHFASPASPVDYANLPIQTLKVGALGTHNALGLAKAKCAAFLLASTSEVYGDPLVHPQKESYWGNVNPIGPRGVYDEAKRFAEAITMAYYRVHQIDVKIIRIFNTYGPRMRLRDGRAIPEFISKALRNEPIPVFGNGSQTRSFCYIDDLVEGIMRTLFSGIHGPVNLGNPVEMSILQLAEQVLKVTGATSRVEYRDLPQDDPKVRQPDISLARKELDWEPNISLPEGLEKTVDYFRTRLQDDK